jgi:hypothetical protein
VPRSDGARLAKRWSYPTYPPSIRSELFYTDSGKCPAQCRQSRTRPYVPFPRAPGRPVRVCVQETPVVFSKHSWGLRFLFCATPPAPRTARHGGFQAAQKSLTVSASRTRLIYVRRMREEIHANDTRCLSFCCRYWPYVLPKRECASGPHNSGQCLDGPFATARNDGSRRARCTASESRRA